MDWNLLIEQIQSNWTSIVATFGVAGGGIWAVISKIRQSKLFLNFDGLNKSFSNIESKVVSKVEALSKILYDKLEVFEERMKIAESQNLELKKENVLLANAVVELVSVANVPVQAKEKFYGGLNSLSIINEKVGEALNTTIEVQKISKTVELQKSQETIDKLSGV
jgi:hypothetical protein